jgi:hypothetical protein
VEYEETPLAQYKVRYQPDKKHFKDVPGVLPLDMVDNSTSPFELVPGWFYLIRLPRQATSPCNSPPLFAFIYTEPPTAISRGIFSLD